MIEDGAAAWAPIQAKDVPTLIFLRDDMEVARVVRPTDAAVIEEAVATHENVRCLRLLVRMSFP